MLVCPESCAEVPGAVGTCGATAGGADDTGGAYGAGATAGCGSELCAPAALIGSSKSGGNANPPAPEGEALTTLGFTRVGGGEYGVGCAGSEPVDPLAPPDDDVESGPGDVSVSDEFPGRVPIIRVGAVPTSPPGSVGRSVAAAA